MFVVLWSTNLVVIVSYIPLLQDRALMFQLFNLHQTHAAVGNCFHYKRRPMTSPGKNYLLEPKFKVTYLESGDPISLGNVATKRTRIHPNGFWGIRKIKVNHFGILTSKKNVDTRSDGLST